MRIIPIIMQSSIINAFGKRVNSQTKIFIKLHTIKPGWSIVYIEGHILLFPKHIAFRLQKINFTLPNSADPGEMPHVEYSMSVKLLTEHHLEFLSLKGGYTGSSESTLVKMPHSWKSHALAHF